GAAYVPLDPDYPAERVRFILQDCSASALLTCNDLASRAEGFKGQTILIDSPELYAQATEQSTLPKPETRPDDVCYVIYTSGTTGRPKGVQIEHHSACHLVQTEREIFQLRPEDRVFQGFSLAFDASVEEI